MSTNAERMHEAAEWLESKKFELRQHPTRLRRLLAALGIGRQRRKGSCPGIGCDCKTHRTS